MTIIDFLSEDHQEVLSYKSIMKEFISNDYHKITDRNDLLSFIENIAFENNHIIILAHGGPEGIANNSNGDNGIWWHELVDSISRREILIPFVLNLTSTCKSSTIENFLNNRPVQLHQVWTSIDNTAKLSASFTLCKYGFNQASVIPGKFKLI